MDAAGPMAFFAADIPFGHGFILNVVVNGMTAIAERTGRALLIIRRVKRHPPIGVRGDHISAPDLMRDIPLCREREIIVAFLREIPLLPFTAVNEGDVVLGKFHEWIGFCQIGQNGFGMSFGIANNIGHASLAPTCVNV